jgi:hypothetical protein
MPGALATRLEEKRKEAAAEARSKYKPRGVTGGRPATKEERAFIVAMMSAPGASARKVMNASCNSHLNLSISSLCRWVKAKEMPREKAGRPSAIDAQGIVDEAGGLRILEEASEHAPRSVLLQAIQNAAVSTSRRRGGKRVFRVSEKTARKYLNLYMKKRQLGATHDRQVEACSDPISATCHAGMTEALRLSGRAGAPIPPQRRVNFDWSCTYCEAGGATVRRTTLYTIDEETIAVAQEVLDKDARADAPLKKKAKGGKQQEQQRKGMRWSVLFSGAGTTRKPGPRNVKVKRTLGLVSVVRLRSRKRMIDRIAIAILALLTHDNTDS